LKDNSQQVAADFGGGTYKDGAPQINNTTLKVSTINPNTNEPYEDEDTAGLAGERTDLAWSRSGLAALTAVAALVKRMVDVDELQATAFVLLAIAGGLRLDLARPRRSGRSPWPGRRRRSGKPDRSLGWRLAWSLISPPPD
jgi:hypothetical protein